MPLGIVSNEDFEKELGNTVPSVIIKEQDIGRGKENNEVPNELRKIIGEEHIVNGREAGQELAKQFGLNLRSSDAYVHGSTSTNRTNGKQPNLDFLNKARLRVSNRARKVLMKTLSAMEDDVKVNDAGLGELASAAKSMSGIMKDMEPQTLVSQNGQAGPTIIFVAPHVKREDQYEVVRVVE